MQYRVRIFILVVRLSYNTVLDRGLLDVNYIIFLFRIRVTTADSTFYTTERCSHID